MVIPRNMKWASLGMLKWDLRSETNECEIKIWHNLEKELIEVRFWDGISIERVCYVCASILAQLGVK